MSEYLTLAAKALKLHRKGLSNPDIKVKLGLDYSKDVIRAVDIAQRHERIEDCRLTPRELATILALANLERRRIAAGNNSAFNGKYLGGMGWSVGQMLRIIRKRLGLARKGETVRGDVSMLWGATGLGLVHHWHGGGVKLTRAGWALVHALEAAEVAGKQQQ